MPQIDGYSLAFPIVAGKLHPNKKDIAITSVVGTSFYIGNGFYITAGHVLAEAAAFEMFALGVTESSKPWLAVKIDSIEIIEGIDIGVFKAQHTVTKACPWERNFVGGLTNVVVSGYPHALYKDPASIYRRDFKGYVITRRPYIRLDLKPNIYELSLACPRGSSGSFVIDDGTGHVCGVVIGSDKSEVDLHYITEEIIERDGKDVYHKTETSTYGIAIASKDILELEFELLGGKIVNHLANQNLLD